MGQIILENLPNGATTPKADTALIYSPMTDAYYTVADLQRERKCQYVICDSALAVKGFDVNTPEFYVTYGCGTQILPFAKYNVTVTRDKVVAQEDSSADLFDCQMTYLDIERGECDLSINRKDMTQTMFPAESVLYEIETVNVTSLDLSGENLKSLRLMGDGKLKEVNLKYESFRGIIYISGFGGKSLCVSNITDRAVISVTDNCLNLDTIYLYGNAKSIVRVNLPDFLIPKVKIVAPLLEKVVVMMR